jgi:hypothetical protein
MTGEHSEGPIIHDNRIHDSSGGDVEATRKRYRVEVTVDRDRYVQLLEIEKAASAYVNIRSNAAWHQLVNALQPPQTEDTERPVLHLGKLAEALGIEDPE